MNIENIKKENIAKHNIAIHCPTQEEANQVVDILDYIKPIWTNYWKNYQSHTCYHPQTITFSPASHYKEELSSTIITAKDFIAANTEPLIQVGTVIKWMYQYEIIAIHDNGMVDIKSINGHEIGRIWPQHDTVEAVTKQVKEGNITIISQPTTNMQTQTISRKGMKEIYDVACADWKVKISELTVKYSEVFSDNVILPQAVVNNMYEASSTAQKAVLNKYFKEEKTFKACDLLVGEIMKCVPVQQSAHYVMRIYDGIIGFDINGVNHSSMKWGTGLPFTGEKLPSGTIVSVTAK